MMVYPGLSLAKTTITLAHSWGPGPLNDEMTNAAKLYHNLHPNIEVKVVGGVTWDKVLSMSAGGVSPDLYVLVSTSVIPYHLQGMLQPITAYVRKSGVKESDFVAPAWKSNIWEGEVIGLPAQADPNFGFFWNKNLFASVGLNQNSAPKTIQEMDIANKKLTIFDGIKLKRIGITPWDVYGNNNSFFTWGWAFGGEFYDAKNKKITANNPKIVAALKWMHSYTKTYPYSAYGGLQTGLTGFLNQKQAMALCTMGDADLQVPKNFQRGYSCIPYDAVGGADNATWVGGFSWVIPKGSKHKDDAFKFMRFALATPEGTSVAIKSSMPAYKKATIFTKAKGDPLKEFYINLLHNARNVRPITPVTNEYRAAIDVALTDVIMKGTKTPEAALDGITTNIQKLLNKALARRRDK